MYNNLKDYIIFMKIGKILTLSGLTRKELYDMKDGEMKNGVIAILKEKCETNFNDRKDILYLYAPKLLEVTTD
jgi:hypothetical protein